jgi:hypothetical protein
MNSFELFCKSNRTFIENKDENLPEPLIKYSDKVFIDMKQIFKLSDSSTKVIIWNHILTISAMVDPLSNSKNILKQNKKPTSSNNSTNSTNNETNFLSNIFNKIEQQIDPNSSNPLDSISSIMSSGIVTDIVNDLQSGNLNFGNILQSVQSMMSSMTPPSDINNNDNTQSNDSTTNELGNMMNMMSTMMKSLGSIDNPETTTQTNTQPLPQTTTETQPQELPQTTTETQP